MSTLRARVGDSESALRHLDLFVKAFILRDGVLRIRDNFEGRMPRWNREGVSKSGRDFEVNLKVGEAIEATLERPATVPPLSP